MSARCERPVGVGAPEPTGFDTRLAAYAVVLDDRDRILLALWNEPDVPRWTLPGGGVDLRESTEEGTVREVREETGYDVVLDRLLGVDTGVIPAQHRYVKTDRPMKAVRVVYAASVVGGELAREIAGTTDEARWWPLAEVPDLPRTALVDVGLALLRQGPGATAP